MTIEERQQATEEVGRIVENIKRTKEQITEYEDMVFNTPDEIDLIGCARWLIDLRYQLKAEEEELENFLQDLY
ncbi:hypothetical protein BCPG3_119 [Bacillus phage BCPG3]|uniref:Uncharacterized protein n=3 Tax=Wphvirus TaxID=1922327 RepID=W5QUP8_9CAUD|nr:hypothetical protein BPS13_0128 [Bacillus phage BPS13]YP_009003013.1 hypothetical protein BPS10C_127 [Bacillus phage BPS10C]YP_009282184.1 hypothetical protein SALINJAH_230 [Bacillus phage SalinJah]QQO38874.1 hypothetical protein BCPG1_143 [Bacillus phage BCPG1]QSJ04436.1 hypothetical protein BCPG3_119 [Bacillus phage BCPG3]QSJ04646.1 hypothetical protein BCP18_114 [Bacillus phage BCP18]AEZ50307.1 hypothetical protein BPS13_0128 [Bacillus phage BPS13]AGI12124.1 hypothetical protein BPS10C